MDKWMDGWTDAWMDDRWTEWVDGWMNRWVGELSYFPTTKRQNRLWTNPSGLMLKIILVQTSETVGDQNPAPTVFFSINKESWIDGTFLTLG